MKNLLLLSFTIIISYSLIGQTPISGVINTYTEVSQVDLTANSVTVSSATGFNIGDKVLLIQMQGATINQSQSASFGTITNANSSGNYEFQTICQIQGNTIRFNHNLLRTYNQSQSIQLISVPQYQSAIISGSDLTSTTWNGTTGGVLVLEAETLNFGSQNIDVTGKGFRGGAAITSGNNCLFIEDPSYYTSFSDPDAKALKGEGIAKFITNKECGRGPQANGGGGGNNHNGGGSGGSNLGTGGAGGKRIKESTFSCGSLVGVNSKDLASEIVMNKVFLGGGGGAGHSNNNGLTGKSGLNGGGIVIVIANVINGNNQSVYASGISSAVNANGDGAGGGGAGGSILIDADTILSTLNVYVNGSPGISTNNNGSNNCSGPGGGGGGGVIWVSKPAPFPNLNFSFTGGAAGIIATTSQSNCTVGSTNGAQLGTNGNLLNNLNLAIGYEFFASSTITETACNSYTSPSGNDVWNTSGTYFDTLNTNGCDSVIKINLTINSVDTTVIKTGIELISVVTGAVYQWIDCENFTPIPGANNQSYIPTISGFYALQITQNGCTDTSSCHQVTNVGIIKHDFGSDLSVYPNPTTGLITIKLNHISTTISYSLFDVLGQHISSSTTISSEKFEIYIPGPTGIYILKTQSDDGRQAVLRILKK